MPETWTEPKWILDVDGPEDLTPAKAFANIQWLLSARPEYTVSLDAGVLGMLYSSYFSPVHVIYRVESGSLYALEGQGLLTLKLQGSTEHAHVTLTEGPTRR